MKKLNELFYLKEYFKKPHTKKHTPFKKHLKQTLKASQGEK